MKRPRRSISVEKLLEAGEQTDELKAARLRNALKQTWPDINTVHKLISGTRAIVGRASDFNLVRKVDEFDFLPNVGLQSAQYLNRRLRDLGYPAIPLIREHRTTRGHVTGTTNISFGGT